jgi:hypothetical protein
MIRFSILLRFTSDCELGGREETTMRRSIFFQPLAVLMALLVAPPLSWLCGLGSRTSGNGSVAFRAAAQTSSATNRIAPGYPQEHEMVRAYLALHQLPATDENLVYDVGRTDLRDEIRGAMMANILQIIRKPAADRTPNENLTFSWFQKLVQANEIAQYTAAAKEYTRFLTDTCNFELDPDIAKQYNLKFSGKSWCAEHIGFSSIFPAPVPASSYFSTYGYKNSYGKLASTEPNFMQRVAGTALGIGEIYGIATGAAAFAGAVTAGSIVAYLAATPVIAGSFTEVTAAGFITTERFASLGASTLSAGPAALLLICIIAGVIASVRLASDEKNRKDLEAMSATLAYVTNNPPDLAGLASSKEGLLKLYLTFTAQTVPDSPGTAPLPPHAGTDLVFLVTPSGPDPAPRVTYPEPTGMTDTFTYQDWNGFKWSAQTSGGWFVQTCIGSEANGWAPSACSQADSLNASIRYVDWSGAKWSASRIGKGLVRDRFISTKATPNPTDKGCPADSLTGVSPETVTDVSACTSYVSTAIPLKNSKGQNVLVLLTLPPGVVPGLSQFSSPDSVGSFYDVPFQFLVTTTSLDSSVPKLSVNWLPDGVTFTDNGGGTATIRGTIPRGYGLVCLGGGDCPIVSTITATNAWGAATQHFNFSSGYAPSVSLVTSSATFLAGVPNAVTLYSQGAQTKVSWGMSGPSLTPAPSWLTLTDQGNGIAVLSGTPPAGIAAAYPLHVSVNAAGSAFGVLDFNANFTLNVSDAPALLSAGPAQFAVGTNGAFKATFTSGTVSLTTGTLPAGLLARQSGTSFGISGTPAKDTGGVYPLTLTATNGSGSASKDVRVEVFEQPAFTTDVKIKPNFYQGQKNSFSFTTSGYPDRGKAPSVANPPVPTDPAQGLGMYFTVTGLPPSLTYTGLDRAGYTTGTLTISGTPAQADLGDHVVTFKAVNGVGAAAEQTFVLTLSRSIGDVDGNGFTFCSDVLALDAVFGSDISQPAYNSRADINNDALVDWADMQLVWSHLYDASMGATAACQQAIHKPSTPTVFQHAADGASTSHEDTIINYITSGGVKDTATLSMGIWTGLRGSGPDLVYMTWDGALRSARVLPDGVTFQSTNPSTGEVRISQVLEYRTWDGSHWKVSVIRPSW